MQAKHPCAKHSFIQNKEVIFLKERKERRGEEGEKKGKIKKGEAICEAGVSSAIRFV